MVADGHARHSGADLLHDSGALVAEHCRTHRLRRSVDGVVVGVADAARPEPDEHLLGSRWSELELRDGERAACLLEHDAA